MKKLTIIMGTILVTITLAVPGSLLLAHGSDNKQPTDIYFIGSQSDPGKVVSRFHDALKSGNKHIVLELLADDVMIYEGGKVERSAAEYANHHMEADMKYLSVMQSKLIEHQVINNGNLAISSSRSQVKGEHKGVVVERISMETIVLKKSKGLWKIFRVHWS